MQVFTCYFIYISIFSRFKDKIVAIYYACTSWNKTNLTNELEILYIFGILILLELNFYENTLIRFVEK